MANWKFCIKTPFRYVSMKSCVEMVSSSTFDLNYFTLLLIPSDTSCSLILQFCNIKICINKLKLLIICLLTGFLRLKFLLQGTCSFLLTSLLNVIYMYRLLPLNSSLSLLIGICMGFCCS